MTSKLKCLVILGDPICSRVAATVADGEGARALNKGGVGQSHFLRSGSMRLGNRDESLIIYAVIGNRWMLTFITYLGPFCPY